MAYLVPYYATVVAWLLPLVAVEVFLAWGGGGTPFLRAGISPANAACAHALAAVLWGALSTRPLVAPNLLQYVTPLRFLWMLCGAYGPEPQRRARAMLAWLEDGRTVFEKEHQQLRDVARGAAQLFLCQRR